MRSYHHPELATRKGLRTRIRPLKIILFLVAFADFVAKSDATHNQTLEYIIRMSEKICQSFFHLMQK